MYNLYEESTLDHLGIWAGPQSSEHRDSQNVLGSAGINVLMQLSWIF